MQPNTSNIDYDTFSVKLSYKLMNDPSLIEKHGISKEAFDKFKQEWAEKHPTPEGKKILEASRKVIVEALKLKRYAAVLEILLNYKGDARQVFKAAGISYIKDETKRSEWLVKEISKSSQKLEILNAQKLKLEKDLEKIETQEQEFNVADINMAFASLEKHGVIIPDYETLAWGRYDAHTKLIEKEIAQRNNGGQ